MNPTAGHYYCRGCSRKLWLPGRGCGTVEAGWELVRVPYTLNYEEAVFCRGCIGYRRDQEEQARKDAERRAAEVEQAKRIELLEAEVARLREANKPEPAPSVTLPTPRSVRTVAPTPQIPLHLLHYYGG